MKKEELMRKAIELSIENVANGGGPFGAVIAKDGEIIATGANRVTSQCDPTAHAEVSAIRAAASKLAIPRLCLFCLFLLSACQPLPEYPLVCPLLPVPLHPLLRILLPPRCAAMSC